MNNDSGNNVIQGNNFKNLNNNLLSLIIEIAG